MLKFFNKICVCFVAVVKIDGNTY